MKSARKKTSSSKRNKLDSYVIGILVSAVLFTLVMVIVFIVKDSIPDTLCTCFFTFIGFECGAMATIKNTVERQETRKWELEDRKLETIKDNLEKMSDG